nr:TetR/AcrR family transcriptional regulator [Cryptosporangium phraense]
MSWPWARRNTQSRRSPRPDREGGSAAGRRARERGSAVTTAEVARAAGIAEGTIFRVFPDKTALWDACVAEALRPDHVLAELASIELDEPLAARLVEAADALAAHLGRMGAVIGSLHATGGVPLRRGPAPGDPGGGVHAALISNALGRDSSTDDPDASPAAAAAGPGAPGAGGAGAPGAGAGGAGAVGVGSAGAPGAGSAGTPGAGSAGTPGPDSTGAPGAGGAGAPGAGAAVRGRAASADAIVTALAGLFEPEREQLRVTPETAASILLYSSQGRRTPPPTPPPTRPSTSRPSSTFPHGARSRPREPPGSPEPSRSPPPPRPPPSPAGPSSARTCSSRATTDAR